MKLWEIAGNIKKILRDNRDPETGLLSDDAFNQISDLELDAVTKIHSCGNALRKLEFRIESMTKLESKLRKEKKALKSDYQRLERYTAFFMRQMGIEEVFKDGLHVEVKDLKDEIEVDVMTLLESAPEFVKVASYRAMIRDLKNYIFKNKNKPPEGVKVITNRLGLKI